MSADEALGEQFVQRRAAQLKKEGRSLVRQLPPQPGTEEEARFKHPAGKRRPLRSV